MIVLELLEVFINNIAPILLIAGTGWLVARIMPIDAKSISSLIYYIFSPALVFYALYTSNIGGSELFSLYGASILMQLTVASVAFMATRIQNINRVDSVTLMIGTIFTNTGNFGLSLVSFAFGPEIFSRAIIIYIAHTTMNYSFGVFVASNGQGSLRDALLNILKTPAVYGIFLAFILRGVELQLPLALERTTERLADASIPLMLVLLGVQLRQFTQLTKVHLLAMGVGLRLLATPFLALGIATLLALPPESYTAFIIQSSMPTAVLSLIFATQFDLDRDLALNIILTTTLLSPVTLSILIVLLS